MIPETDMIHGTIFPEPHSKSFDISISYVKKYLDVDMFYGQTLTRFKTTESGDSFLNDVCYLKYCEKKGLTFSILENGLVSCGDILYNLNF